MKHLNIKPKDYKFHNFIEFVGKEYYEIDYCDFNEDRARFKNIYE